MNVNDRLSIIRKVITDITGTDPKEDTRTLDAMLSKNVFYVISNMCSSVTYYDIGEAIGRKHGAVRHGIRSMNNEYLQTDEYKVLLHECVKKLNSLDESILMMADIDVKRYSGLTGVKLLIEAKNEKIHSLSTYVHKLEVQVRKHEAMNASLNKRLNKISILCQMK
jgi:hypothetical protein